MFSIKEAIMSAITIKTEAEFRTQRAKEIVEWRNSSTPKQRAWVNKELFKGKRKE